MDLLFLLFEIILKTNPYRLIENLGNCYRDYQELLNGLFVFDDSEN